MKIKLSEKQLDKISKKLGKPRAPEMVQLTENEMFALVDFFEEVPGASHFTISLHPTGIGTVLIVRDNTGRQKDISDYDNW